ncbi:hypothetical protein [Nitrobacter vulgaris]|uniref:Uncharacterized protein n=1 Tax=Nitrobacter vulgaris TaxID=29421 RepID=A0A1V4HUH5_NITVU|nr:hypothetical protein [Nitrobacter vulgaris]OPH81485.1 hypothetical protein B2M20_17535 [Nitrobacter vulgaris]
MRKEIEEVVKDTAAVGLSAAVIGRDLGTELAATPWLLIPEQAAHLFQDDAAHLFRLIVAQHSD